MIKNKKVVVLISFLVGFIIFISATFAEIAELSPYEYTKKNLKHSSKVYAKDTDSYTFEGEYVFKIDGKIVHNEKLIEKTDFKNNRKESSIENEFGISYGYEDGILNVEKKYSDMYLISTIEEDDFKVTGFSSEWNNEFKDSRYIMFEKVFDNTFKQDYNNLKKIKKGKDNYILGELKSSKMSSVLKSSIAILFKTIIDEEKINYTERNDLKDEYSNFKSSRLTGVVVFDDKDHFKECSLIFLGTTTDKSGEKVNLELVVTAKVSNVNSTIVNAFSKDGKNIEYSQDDNINNFYQGEYENDILILKNDKYIKIGKKTMIVEKKNEEEINCIYSEKYIDKYKKNHKDLSEKFQAIKEENEFAFKYNDREKTKFVEIFQNVNELSYFNDKGEKSILYRVLEK
ncbi:MAG: hypothetical protein ABF289_02685 [Clostridiales bacterium]